MLDQSDHGRHLQGGHLPQQNIRTDHRVLVGNTLESHGDIPTPCELCIVRLLRDQSSAIGIEEHAEAEIVQPMEVHDQPNHELLPNHPKRRLPQLSLLPWVRMPGYIHQHLLLLNLTILCVWKTCTAEKRILGHFTQCLATHFGCHARRALPVRVLHAGLL